MMHRSVLLDHLKRHAKLVDSLVDISPDDKVILQNARDLGEIDFFLAHDEKRIRTFLAYLIDKTNNPFKGSGGRIDFSNQIWTSRWITDQGRGIW